MGFQSAFICSLIFIANPWVQQSDATTTTQPPSTTLQGHTTPFVTITSTTTHVPTSLPTTPLATFVTTTPLATFVTTTPLATFVTTTPSAMLETTTPLTTFATFVTITPSATFVTTTPSATFVTTTPVATSVTPSTVLSSMATTPASVTTPAVFNCSVHGCMNDGTCIPSGSCLCPLWLTGQRCTEYVACPPSYCVIDHVDGGNCTVEDGRPVCHCNGGFSGDRCQTRDLCYSGPCENNGTCLTTPGSYQCRCVTGDPNRQCALNTDNKGCQLNPPHGVASYITCIDLIRDPAYNLICRPGRGGQGCIQDIDAAEQCSHCEDQGYCKPLCKYTVCNATDNCNFTIVPYPATNVTASGCRQTFANGYPNLRECDTEEHLFDGFDGIRGGDNPISDCSPFFDTICTRNASDGVCNPYCNNTACLYDGLDCLQGRLPMLDGAVVVDFVDKRFTAFSYFGFLLRSGVVWETAESMTNQSVYLKIVQPSAMGSGSTNESSIGQFTSIETVGRFLSAVIAKLPLDHVVGVTDVWVCEARKYNRQAGDHCSLSCSATCLQQGDVCHWQTGNCLQGCEAGWWGEKCTNRCHANCVGTCGNDGHCISCGRGKYGAECERDCDRGCVTYSCDITTGQCRCGVNHFWFADTARCTGCSSGCADNRCSGSNGECICSPGNYGPRCQSKCPNCHSLLCNQNDGYCGSGCQEGYHGNRCDRKCAEGCVACEQADGQCNGQCKPGHEGNTCSKRSVIIEARTSGNAGVAIAIVIAIIIFISVAVIAVCYWRWKQSGDYILEDEINSPVQQANTMEVKNSIGLQPVPHTIGVSSDMIDMDEKLGAGVYAGPDRHSVSLNQPNAEIGIQQAGTATVIISDETKLISDGKEITFARDDEVIATVDVSNEEEASDSATKEGPPPITVDSRIDDELVGSTTDEGPSLHSDDDLIDDEPVLSPKVFLSVSIDQAPLASEEDLTAASLEDVTAIEDVATEPTQSEPDTCSDRGSERKESTSSISSSSSSSTDSSTGERIKTSL